MSSTAMPPRVRNPPLQVVVDVLQQHRRTGGDRWWRSSKSRSPMAATTRVAGRPLLLDVGVADEPGDQLGVPVVGEEGPEGLADLAAVVEQQELHPCRVVEGAGLGGHRAEAGEGGDGVVRCGSPWRPRRARAPVAARSAMPATLAVASSVGSPFGRGGHESRVNSSAV